MKWMRWGWADLCEAPAEVVDRIVELMVEQNERDEDGR